MTKTIVLVF